MSRFVLSIAPALLALGCSSDWTTGEIQQRGSGGSGGQTHVSDGHPVRLRVNGNRIVDADGTDIVLRGVNRSGSEYRCIQGAGFFDGPDDERSVAAIASWPNVNAVRVPLNETCWLGINGVPDSMSGENYKAAIQNYVALLHKYDLIPILELHWAAPGDLRADEQYLMPNADHSPDFWRDVATTFLDDSGVIFEPFNEPAFNGPDWESDAAWSCWRDGCTYPATRSSEPYEAAGMQSLLDAIRETGSEHVLLFGGIEYSNNLSRWLEFMPTDPLANIGAAWHIYNFNACVSAAGCWDDQPARIAETVPLVATEIGQNNCEGGFIQPLMQWLDARNSGYLAWSWNTLGACQPGDASRAWALVTSYYDPQPQSAYAQAFRDHLLQLTP